MKRFILSLFILLLLISCTTVKDQPVFEPPAWETFSSGVGNRLIFSGEDILGNYHSAYRSLFMSLEQSIGFSLDETYFAELLETDAIETFGLVITNKHQRDGGAFLQARADEQVVNQVRATLLKERNARDEKIEALIQEANLAYKSNDDTTTIARYLEAALVAEGGSVSQKNHEADRLLEEALGYIEALRFALTRSDSSTARTTVTLRRRTRLLAPRVLNAPITAKAEAYNALGDLYVDTLYFNSQSSGQLLFTPLNPAIKHEGVITFGVDIEIPPLREDRKQRVKTALDKVVIDFPYSLRSAVGSQAIGLSLREYSIRGDLLPTATSSSSFLIAGRRDGIALEVIDLNRGTEDELEELLQAIPRSTRYSVIGSVGVLSFDQALGEAISVVSGSIILYDSQRATILYESKDIEAVGWGKTQSEAMNSGFERFGSIAEYLLRTVLMDLR